VRMLYAKIKKSGELIMEAKGHHDFTTPEYSVYKEARKKKWESTRGVGKSFAYNQVEVEADMLTGKEIIHMLSDIVSKNGNLLLNVGPMPDGTIPEMQKRPLLEVGDWLKINGEAIYGTRPWTRAEGVTDDNKPMRFTQKDNVLYAILNDGVLPKKLIIKDLSLNSNAAVRLLGGTQADALAWRMAGSDLVIDLPDGLPQQHAYAFAISPSA
jgi:alpha-L-fucosidase